MPEQLEVHLIRNGYRKRPYCGNPGVVILYYQWRNDHPGDLSA